MITGYFSQKIIKTTFALVCALMAGCATQSEIKKFYNPSEPALEQKPNNPAHVEVIEPANTNQMMAFIKERLGQQSYRRLGSASFSGPKVSLAELRRFAASVGGDYVVRTAEFAGIQQGSRMVVGSYTPPSSTYSTGTAYGTASGTSYSSGSTPFGSYNQTTYGSGSSFGTATATTFNPGQVNYVRDNFNYPTFNQTITVMQSPQAQKRNWANMQSFLTIDKEGYELDLSKVSTEEQIKKAPPAIQEMIKQMKAGRKFTPIEAQQFIILYDYAKFWRDNWQEVLKLLK